MFNLKAILKSVVPFDIAALYPFLFTQEWKKSDEIYKLLQEYFNTDDETANILVTRFRESHLKQIMLLATSSTEYYKNISTLNSKDNYDITKFPLLTKEIIRSEFNTLINKNINSLKWFNFNTGGSTGEPLLFRVTRQCGLVDRVHQKFFFEKIGFQDKDKIFAFDGVIIPASKTRKNIFWSKVSASELPYGSIHFSSHFFNETSAKHYLNKILDEKPAILRGYPSFIADLAIFAKQLGVKKINFIKGVLLTSEAILDYQVSIIKEVFDAPVILQYGHSEMAVFAVQMPNENHYWCSPFYGLTEILNLSGEHVKIGEVGEIVVTSYYNTAMPFIRYRTGDFAQYGGEKNGATILESLQGREQDFIYTIKNEKVSITGLIFGSHYSAFKNIKKWQIKQSKPGEVTIFVVPGDKFKTHDEKELIRSFNNLASVKATVKCVSEIPLTKRGKFRFVIHEK